MNMVKNAWHVLGLKIWSFLEQKTGIAFLFGDVSVWNFQNYRFYLYISEQTFTWNNIVFGKTNRFSWNCFSVCSTKAWNRHYAKIYLCQYRADQWIRIGYIWIRFGVLENVGFCIKPNFLHRSVCKKLEVPPA